GGRRQGGRRGATVLGRRRKLARRQRLHPRLEAVGRDRHALAALVFLDANFRLRQRADNLEELLGREREDARRGDRRFALRPHADVEIRGEQRRLVVAGVDQDVREDRNRVLPFDDALEQGELFQKIVLADDEFHGQDDLSNHPQK